MKHLEFLKTAHQKGALAHAYLVSGNDQKGKNALIADFLSFLSEGSKSSLASDVIGVEPQGDEITVGQIRRLKEQLSLSPWVLPLKVGVINQAEAMNKEAQSALLKLLEEPAKSALLLLETEHPALLFDTVRSRTQELRMYAFGGEAIGQQGLLKKLQTASLAERFAFAEKASGEPEKLVSALKDLQREARLEFLSGFSKEQTRLLQNFHSVLSALQRTQVNPRYAAERILLEL